MNQEMNCENTEMEQQTELFDFDSDDNRTSAKTPALKAIGGGIKDKNGKVIGAGLWMAHENAEICQWKKDCTDTCDYSCMDHLKGMTYHGVDTKKVDDDGNDIIIPGSVILKPRMLVIGRSPLLKISEDSGYTVGVWVKGDNRFKGPDGKKNLYACVRRYFIIFVDEDNKPLHDINQPIQLTARGYFQMEFDKMLMFFRSTMIKAYCEAMKKNATNMKEAWHSMCVFAPLFKSEMKGPSKDKQSKACITYGFDKPTKDNWLTMCVGRNKEAQDIYKIHVENKEWWQKSIKKDQQKSEEEEHPNDDHVYMTEEDDIEKIERGIESLGNGH